MNAPRKIHQPDYPQAYGLAVVLDFPGAKDQKAPHQEAGHLHFKYDEVLVDLAVNFTLEGLITDLKLSSPTKRAREIELSPVALKSAVEAVKEQFRNENLRLGLFQSCDSDCEWLTLDIIALDDSTNTKQRLDDFLDNNFEKLEALQSGKLVISVRYS